MIISRPVLFKTWVRKCAITEGRWKIIGHVTPGADVAEIPLFCKQDSISGAYYKYFEGKEHSATYEECTGLEVAAVWEANHIEERLRDHYAGRLNKWLELIKLKRDGSR
jgi:hypothetical protein